MMNASAQRIHPALPVFRLEGRGRCVLYTPPGHLAVVDSEVADKIALAWGRNRAPEETTAHQVSTWLQTQAEQAAEKWQQWMSSPFRPECLTIYLSNHCQLGCSYCYVVPARQGENRITGKFPVIREDAALTAARLMAQNCVGQGKPFYLVLHGGGEPSFHWELVERLEISTRQLAQQFGIEWRGHFATNGILSAQQARWLARHFTSIGLSCDGPPDIQNRQRPFSGGEATSAIVERTAGTLKNAGGNFTIRTTITPQTIDRQAEIVAYLHECLSAEDIRFEPVYAVRGTGQEGFRPDDAACFVEHFLEAQEEARTRGISLRFSGVRIEELHGPYCDVLRNVLHLNPDGTATVCFFSTTGQGNGSSLVVGHFDKSTQQFVVDHDRIEAHRQRALDIPHACFSCVNIYHCTRGCPEFCSLSHFSAAGFRCQVHQQLVSAWLLEAAEKLMNVKQEETNTHHSERDSSYERVRSYLCDLPPDIDIDTIVRQWEAVRNAYRIEKRRMPSPIWVERGFEHDASDAWQQLCRDIPSRNTDGAMAIYIHIPFCDRHCGFCDCLSLALGTRKRREHEYTYLRELFAEIHVWSNLPPLRQRPISTIHFGGGTPNCLSASGFSELLNRCRAHFHLTPDTELALESTSSLLNPEHLEWLGQLGFSRLHVGVQTLEEPLRKSIGRREEAERVLKKLAHALKMGFVTSVDVIYGLPGQTLLGLIDTLKRLIDAGIHGVSLYRLNRSNRNRRFFEKFPRFTPNALYDYLLFQVAEQIFIQAGYRKNHFTHFAKPEDRNQYYTHARRGEDLLALGPTADGVFEDYHYRHPDYETYTAGSHTDTPTLEGGIRETTLEHRFASAINELLTANLSRPTFQQLHVESLLDRWQKRVLVQEEDSIHNSLSLTANGSWFVSDLISELRN